jgi:hypothetical protein
LLCAEHVSQFRGESPRPNLMEVKGVAKRKGRRREARPERSAERKREPMNKNRMKRRERWASGQLTAKRISIKSAERKSGGCAWKAAGLTSGDLRRVPTGTGRAGRPFDRGAEVSSGHSRREQSVHSIGTLARKGRNGRARRTGNVAYEGPNGEER